jgi:hypothetical protein
MKKMFIKKLAIYLFLGLSSYRRNRNPSPRTTGTTKHEISSLCFFLVGNFCLGRSRSRSECPVRIRIHIPKRIRIQSGSEGYCENPMPIYWSPDGEYSLHHNVGEQVGLLGMDLRAQRRPVTETCVKKQDVRAIICWNAIKKRMKCNLCRVFRHNPEWYIMELDISWKIIILEAD